MVPAMRSRGLVKNSVVNPNEEVKVKGGGCRSSLAPREPPKGYSYQTHPEEKSSSGLVDYNQRPFRGTSLDLPVLPILEEETPQSESCYNDSDSDSKKSPLLITTTSHDSPITTSHLSARLPEDQADAAPIKRFSKKSRPSNPPRRRVVVNGELL